MLLFFLEKKRISWIFIGIFSIVCGACGFLAEYIGGIVGCFLCGVERTIFVTAGGCALPLWCSRKSSISFTILSMVCIVLWAANGVIGAYHAGMQYGLWRAPAFCQVHEGKGGSVGEKLDDFLSQKIRPSCAEKTITIAGVHGSVFVSILSFFCCFLGVLLFLRRKDVYRTFL